MKTDTLIAVLYNDAMFSGFKDISNLPEVVVNRLKHYFLTYKDLPGNEADVIITHIYGAEEAAEVINRAMEDYRRKSEPLNDAVSPV
ncbi:MAG: inorganic diphosphatase [Bacteroidales bacterium]|nr:inorganic diphosphatase [Bacteroidales bacterium]